MKDRGQCGNRPAPRACAPARLHLPSFPIRDSSWDFRTETFTCHPAGALAAKGERSGLLPAENAGEHHLDSQGCGAALSGASRCASAHTPGRCTNPWPTKEGDDHAYENPADRASGHRCSRDGHSHDCTCRSALVQSGKRLGLPEISSNHATLNVCRILGSWPDSDVWGTVRYSGGTLIRYDAPTLSGLRYNHTLRSNPTDVRFCWRPSGTNNQCTAWKAV